MTYEIIRLQANPTNVTMNEDHIARLNNLETLRKEILDLGVYKHPSVGLLDLEQALDSMEIHMPTKGFKTGDASGIIGEEDKQTGYITLIGLLMEYLHEEKKFRDNPEADNYLVNE